jgi:hypothetical protein
MFVLFISVGVVGTGVTTMLDVWVELLFKTIRHGWHDVMPKEDDNAGRDAPGINTPRAHWFPTSLAYKKGVETYKIYIFKGSAP